MKKTLRTILLERTDTIEYRAIKASLMKVAQNGGNSTYRLKIEPKTIDRLQSEQITVKKVNEHGYETHKISW